MATKTINNALSELLSQYEIDKQVGIESKFLAQYVVSVINSLSGLRDKIIDKQEEKAVIIKKDELFEKCWIAYRRKGQKCKAKPYWNKLTEEEKQRVLPHIKVYVTVKDLSFQKDFERYLKDKFFDTIIVKGNDVVYDPTCQTEAEYHPYGNLSLMFSEKYQCYIYIGYYDGTLIDGYTDDERPDGATVMLNSGRGTIVWSKSEKRWVLKK